MSDARPIAISAGDPAGIGPEIAVRAAHARRHRMRTVIFGDASALRARAEVLGFDTRVFLNVESHKHIEVDLDCVGLVDTGAVSVDAVHAHAPTHEGGAAQLRALDEAASLVMKKGARALVTGPVSKAAITLAGTKFVGQTEHLARMAGLQDDDVSMLFIGPRLRVSLVTTHLSIANVPKNITAARVARSTRHLAESLMRLREFANNSPRIVIASLNPHAGEGGLFGNEEKDVLEPVFRALSEAAPFSTGRALLLGVRPAETAFRDAASGRVDGVVAMFHDQATIASKLLDWGAAVNVTWGLPFVRTSVDHGVAYDAAASGNAEIEGMLAALDLADALTKDGR